MQNRYKYIFDSTTNTYNFTTKNNICYRVSFVVDETFSTLRGQVAPHKLHEFHPIMT